MKKNSFIINIGLIVLTFIGSYIAYLRLPERVASHWDLQGQVNGYMNRFSGAFFLPFLLVGLFLLLTFLPNIDPKKKNLVKFQDTYYAFITVFILYMIYIHGLTLAFNLGYQFDFVRAMMPGFAVLFYFIGWMLPKAKSNWFIGIRTPWTMSNDEVWAKTHQMAGKLFKTTGILALFGAIIPGTAFYFVFILIIVSSIYTVIYLYLEYKKIEK